MDTVIIIARLVLAGVFIVAGVAKLADRSGSRRAVADFGVPATLATPLGILLPLTELVVAGSLIPASTAWWGAIAALALLLLFMLGIGVNLARGRKPECHCFGQLHSAPAGWSTLARNGILAAIAGFIVWEGREEGAGPSVVSWIGALSTTQLVGLLLGAGVLVLLVANGWFLVHLLRQNGRLLMRLEALEARLGTGGGAPSQNGAQQPVGLPVGSEAPAFSLQGLYEETLTLAALRASGKPLMLLFTDPNCVPCNALLPDIGRWQQEHADKLTISLISRGAVEENRTKSTEHGLTGVLLQKDWEVSEAYQVSGTPSAVLIGHDGKIASHLINGVEDIRAFVAQAVGAPAQPPSNGNDTPQQAVPQGSKVGKPAPKVKLPNLEGKIVKLADFRGSETLVLFWNPGCGFCQQMLPDLREWEANPPEGAPKLLIVSAGTVEANKEMGLNSPVVLDQEFAVGRAFGANGTPSAVLVDAKGKIASDLAVGAPGVLALTRGRQGQT